MKQTNNGVVGLGYVGVLLARLFSKKQPTVGFDAKPNHRETPEDEKHTKKVLIFLFGGVGGAERMSVNIGKMLPTDQFDVKFVICGRLMDILQFIPDNYEVVRIPWLNIHVFPRLRMWWVMRRVRPDFVFSSTTFLNVLLLQVAGFMNVKCIVRHDNTVQAYSKRTQRKMAVTYKSAYRIIAQQEEMQRDLMELTGTNETHVVCLHNPLDLKNILPKLNEPSPYPNDGNDKYLFIGNFLHTKGHDILAEAFKLVHSRNPKTHLYFVGKINESLPNYVLTKKIIREAGLQDCVHFVGYQVNPYKWIKYCDCFVLPSRMEGLPNALLEAMYIGKPVVASVCIPVIDRMVVEGYNGYKVPPEHPEEMASAMEKALSLKHFHFTYPLASSQDFIELFQ